MKNVAVVGLGFVGLTLSVVASKKGFKTYGIDVNENILNSIKSCKAHFHENGINSAIESVYNEFLFVSDSFERFKVNRFKYIIITVGTPLKDGKKPNLDHLISALKVIKPIYDGSQLLILRSTVSVGTTRQIVLPYICKEYGLNPKDVLLSFCPERTVEGNALQELCELPQIIGALNQKSYELSENFFRKITPTLLKVDSIEAAELVKLFNNTYRDIEFSVGNYFNQIAQSFGINGVDLIKSANYLYPRSKIALPGLVGGPCLEKDSYILVDKMPNNKGKDFVLGARKHNESIDKLVAEWIIGNINSENINRIGLSGMAFKGIPETSDLRGSPSINILRYLQSKTNINYRIHDYLVPIDELNDYSQGYNCFEEFCKDLELLVILTNSKKYKNYSSVHLKKFLKPKCIIFDLWGVLDFSYQKNFKVTTLGDMFKEGARY